MPSFLLIIIFIFLSGCEQEPPLRHYSEITRRVSNAPPGASLPAMGAGLPSQGGVATANDDLKGKITWDIPAGWMEASGEPMRLATLRRRDQPGTFDCSMVALPGGAGGLAANVRRWMGQINLAPDPQDFTAFMAFAPHEVYDFTLLQKGQGADTPSMIVAVKQIGGATVFIKLKGSIAAVKHYRGAFLDLVNSVRPR